jgi:UDP-glucuronate decarboxylase
LRILVTGGAGFLGSHLCERLLSSGNEVIALDNFYTGSKENISNLIGNRNFEIVRQDITEPYQLEVDAIYNLACPASPIHYQKFPVQTIRTSFLGTLNALNLATKLEIPILQASTSEVYGDPNTSPQREDYWGNVNPIGIRACYDEGKRAAETLMFDFQRQFGTQIKIARIFNTYGPNMSISDGRVVSNFIVQALRNQPITIYGSGNQTRSFCYVDDLISGLISLMESDSEVTGPINIGNPNEFTMLQLASKIIELTNSKSVLVYKDLPSDDPQKRCPDVQKAKMLLDWSPKVELELGLTKTINYFSQII